MSKVLEADSVSLEFGLKKVLGNVYVRCEQGRVTGILGRNGAGKSCLLKIIFGSLRAGYANIRFDGKSLATPFRHPQKIKYLPQHSFLPKHLSVSAVLSVCGCDPENLLAVFPEFEQFLNMRTGTLSFGQKRMLETWTVLTSDADFVMLDEPFSYLMPLHAEKLKDLIRSEKKKKGILLTDHLYRDILEVSDTLYLVREGQTYPVAGMEDLRKQGYIN